MKQIMKDRKGETFITNEGYRAIIIDYKTARNIRVSFLDDIGNLSKYCVNTNYHKRKNIKNPYHATILGVACYGVDKNGLKPHQKHQGKITREFSLWHNMIARCYNPKIHETRSSYADCQVCERWLCYADFLEDLPKIEGYELWLKNPNKRIALDKDIRVRGNKTYSLETVCFVEIGENSVEANRRTKSHRIKMTCLETDEVQLFTSLREASRETGYHLKSIHKCCNGLKADYKGCKWEYAKDVAIV